MDAENLLSLAENTTLLESSEDFETYLCEVKDNYCIVSITYEYEEPQINFRTEWYNSEKEAKEVFEKEFN